MNEERIIQQGRLAELRQKSTDLKIRMKGLKDTMRLKIIEFIHPEDLESYLIADLAIQLRAVHIDFMEVTGEIKALEKVLGR